MNKEIVVFACCVCIDCKSVHLMIYQCCVAHSLSRIWKRYTVCKLSFFHLV